MNNEYFMLRHGESYANLSGILSFDSIDGIKNNGLTSLGRRQVAESVLNWKDGDSSIKIYSSDFKRAVDTARIAVDILGAKEIHKTHRLRERDFGNYEGKSKTYLSKIWEMDKDNMYNGNGVEPVDVVSERELSLLQSLEKKYDNQKILLVGHGDSFRILEQAVHSPDIDMTKPMMANGEIKKLHFPSEKVASIEQILDTYFTRSHRAKT